MSGIYSGKHIEGRLTPIRVVPMLRAEGSDAGADIGDDLAHRWILTGYGGATDSRVGVDRDDGECAGDTGIAMRSQAGAFSRVAPERQQDNDSVAQV